MSSTLHDDAVVVLERYVPGEDEQATVREAVLAYVLARPDATSRDCTPDHVTASAVILSTDARQVLLALHRRAGRWFQTGGHLEAGDGSLQAAALREATEESGLTDLAIVEGGPVRIDVHPAPCRTLGVRDHLDVQYVAVSAGAGIPVVSDESLDVRWFSVDGLPEDADASVRALVTAARSRLGR